MGADLDLSFRGLAVLLIDMQSRFVTGEEKLALIPRQIAMLRFCKQTGTPLIVIEYEGEGETIEPLREEFSGSKIYRITKPGDDAFSGTRLKETLDEIGARQLLVMGVNACKCIFDTVSHAVELGYEVIISDDLIAGYCGKSNCNPNYRRKWYRKNTHFMTDHACALGFMG